MAKDKNEEEVTDIYFGSPKAQRDFSTGREAGPARERSATSLQETIRHPTRQKSSRLYKRRLKRPRGRGMR